MRMPWDKRPYRPLVSVEDIAHSAVALAIDPDINDPSIPVAESFVVIAEQEPVIREMTPEYHIGLAKRMVSKLDANEAKILADMQTERDRHEKLMASLVIELDGVRRVRAAYTKAGEVLDGTHAEDPSRIQAPIIGNTRRRKPAATE